MHNYIIDSSEPDRCCRYCRHINDIFQVCLFRDTGDLVRDKELVKSNLHSSAIYSPFVLMQQFDINFNDKLTFVHISYLAKIILCVYKRILNFIY